MCYICNFCKKSQPVGVSAHKVVTQYRQFNHPSRPKAMRRKVVKNGKNKMEYITDPGGLGLQVAREVLACPLCNAEWDRKQREKQGLLPAGQSAKVILPMYKKEVIPEQTRPKRPYVGHRPAFRNNAGPNRFSSRPQ